MRRLTVSQVTFYSKTLIGILLKHTGTASNSTVVKTCLI
jgi:hypothetical protein